MTNSRSIVVNTPYQIKEAEKQDLPICINLLNKFFLEQDSTVFPPRDPSSLATELLSAIEKRSILLVVNNDVAVGIFGLEVKTFPWSTKQYLANDLHFILPEFRSSSLDKRLLSLAEEYAKINKLPLIFSYITTYKVDSLHKLLKRKGYKELGLVMVKS